MRILIATDAWRPQVNGVVSTLERMTQAATELGAAFEFLTPQGMWSAPLPSYPEIRLALPSWRRIRRRRPPFEVARLLRRLGLRFRFVRQHPFQRGAPGLGLALLVIFGVGEA